MLSALLDSDLLLSIPLFYETDVVKIEMPLDFERGLCYAFHEFSSCGMRCKIEDSRQSRKSPEKVAKMGENMKNCIKLTGEDGIKNMTRRVGLREDNDDVQNVCHNWEQED